MCWPLALGKRSLTGCWQHWKTLIVYRREHKRKPRFTKITMLDKLVLTLIYRHEYRSMDSIAAEYEVSRDTIEVNVHWVEQTLLNADLIQKSVTCVYKTN